MRRHTLTRFALVLTLAVMIWVPAVPARGASPASVLTQHNDNGRSGANLNELTLNTSNLSVSQFGKLFARVVDGHIYAQPIGHKLSVT